MSCAWPTCGADSRRAMTLLELIVAMALALLLLALVVSFLVPSLRITTRGTAEAELQQSGTLAVRRLVRDLEQSNVAGISLSDSPRALAIHQVEDVTDRRTRVYSGEIVVYYWEPERRALVRRTWPPDPPALGLTLDPTAPLRLPAASLQALVDEPNGTERVLARYVEDFQITDAGPGDFLAQPFTVRLQLVHSVPQKTLRFEVERQVSLRNVL